MAWKRRLRQRVARAHAIGKGRFGPNPWWTHRRPPDMSSHMTERTTVRLPGDLARRAKRKAASEGRSLAALIEDGLRHVVNVGAPEQTHNRVVPPVSVATGGAGHRSERDSRRAGDGGPGRRCTAQVILADVTVLIHAFRTDTVQHVICEPGLDRLILWRRAVRRIAARVECGGADHDQSLDCQASR